MRPWLLPLVAWQGRRFRRTAVVLPEAEGPRSGRVAPPREPPGDPQGGPAGPRPPSPDPLRLLVCGESTAAGVGVAIHDEGLAARLARELAAADGRAVHWRVVGRTGATIRRIRHRLLPEAVTPPTERTTEPAPRAMPPYDVVVLIAGVNDVLGRRLEAEWSDDLRAVLAGLGDVLRPDGRLLVTGVPPFDRFPTLPRPLATYLAERGRALDRRTAAECARRPDTTFLPADGLLRPESGPDWFAADGFHPGPRGYAEWARALAAVLGSGPRPGGRPAG